MRRGAENAWPDTLMSWSIGYTGTYHRMAKKPDRTWVPYPRIRAQSQAADAINETIGA